VASTPSARINPYAMTAWRCTTIRCLRLIGSTAGDRRHQGAKHDTRRLRPAVSSIKAQRSGANEVRKMTKIRANGKPTWMKVGEFDSHLYNRLHEARDEGWALEAAHALLQNARSAFRIAGADGDWPSAVAEDERVAELQHAFNPGQIIQFHDWDLPPASCAPAIIITRGAIPAAPAQKGKTMKDNSFTQAGAESLRQKLEKHWQSLSSAGAVRFRIEPQGADKHTVWCVRSSLVNGLPGPLLTKPSTSNTVEG
jgi:hypothetical protein